MGLPLPCTEGAEPWTPDTPSCQRLGLLLLNKEAQYCSRSNGTKGSREAGPPCLPGAQT